MANSVDPNQTEEQLAQVWDKQKVGFLDVQ